MLINYIKVFQEANAPITAATVQDFNNQTGVGGAVGMSGGATPILFISIWTIILAMLGLFI